METKTVHSESSHGGYVNWDGGVALPEYLVHLPNQNYFILYIDMEEELNKRVNGGNSDYYGGDEIDFGGTM